MSYEPAKPHSPQQLTAARRAARHAYNQHAGLTDAGAIDAGLTAADRVLGTYGPEELTTARRRFTYCNTGESYSPTVAYNHETGQFQILAGGWAGVYEQDNRHDCPHCGHTPTTRAWTCEQCGHPSAYSRSK